MIRPKLPRAAPAVLPRPTRRLIAATVMFAGTIVPALLFGIRLFFYFFIGVAPLALAVFLTFDLIALWRGRFWAWILAVALFVSGFLICGVVLVLVALDRNFEMILWAAAAAAHFAVGLVAVFSLKRWIDQTHWLSAQDARASIDKPAVLAALRARKR